MDAGHRAGPRANKIAWAVTSRNGFQTMEPTHGSIRLNGRVARYAFWRGQSDRAGSERSRGTGTDREIPFQDETLRKEALEHADALYNLARYLTSNPVEAEDLVQETYARAFATDNSFRGGSLKAWLCRILRNIFIDSYRKGKVHAVTELEVWAEGGTDPGPPESGLALGQMRALVARDLEAALRSLSDDARNTILLDMEGLRENEMAEALGCAAGTIKSRLARARQLLRQKLKDYAR
jgi:RNA polymerase sigma-70 factor (ECF subfamily)